MHYFFDSSALVKVFHAEVGSAKVIAIMDEQGREISASHLAIVEFASVVALKSRTKVMSPAEADYLLDQLFLQISNRRVLIQAILAEDFDRAFDLINLHGRQFGLKTLDALHLATALRQKRQTRLDFFVTGDRALANVARLAGLAVIGPE